MSQFQGLTLDLWSVLLLFGCLHGGFISVVLLLGRSRVKRILAALILVFSYSLFIAFLWQANWMVHLPHLIATSLPLLYLAGPLYYWFFSSALPGRNSLPWWHFTPAVICMLTIVPFYLQSVEFKLEYILSKDVSTVELPATRAIYFGFLFLQMSVYWIGSQRLNRLKPMADGRKSPQLRRLGRWLKALHYAFGFFLLVFLSTYLTLTLSPWNYGEIRYAAQLSMAVVVHFIGYVIISQSAIIAQLKSPGAAESTKPELKSKILASMEKDRLFLDQELNLSSFSYQLNASPSAVSQLINSEFHCNFSEFVNHYRVEEAKKRLTDVRYQHFKVEAIGSEVGFSNKVSFNRAFKKHTGTTPSNLKNSQSGR